MRKFALFFLVLVVSLASLSAQQKDQAEKFIKEGIRLYDSGDYEGALRKYDEALKADADNFFALAEKAMTFHALARFQEAITCCERALKMHPDEPGMKSVYVTYGNCLDLIGKADRSIAIYEEGLKKYPGHYELHFNKGVTLTRLKKFDEALLSFQQSALCNPNHPGTHSSIGRVLSLQDRGVPAMLAYSRFFVLERQSERARQNIVNMQNILKGNAQQTDKKSITVNISEKNLSDTTADGKPAENSFAVAEMMMAFAAALDFDKKYRNETEPERLLRKMTLVCASLSESKKDNFGFYWEYYVPYFLEMNNKNFLETFAYIVYSESDSPDVKKWLKSNESRVEAFYNWSGDYEWKKK